ncbi:MAG: ribonuclease HII [Propionibacteriaceae bacterium]|jgi:ribonuclease HII|nr:ribonuclease HII [Propionibacteriaceae bacterium]
MPIAGLSPIATLAAAGFVTVAGADEAGRGACAGPLVAAAVILPTDPTTGEVTDARLARLDDSKKLTPLARERLFDVICDAAVSFNIVSVSALDCDTFGIQEANVQALRRALLGLDVPPDYAICDGFAVDGLPWPSIGMWKGDQVVSCVSAASILAKVSRDRTMCQLALDYPGYALEGHKGYATAVHQAALERLGPSPIHRLSYANVAAVLTR